MKILVAHNFYQQAGGEDQCVAAEITMLKAHGHTVIEYFLNNAAIDGMHPISAGSRALWNGAAFSALRFLIREYRPHVAHFHNTFPLISPAAYYAARREKVPVVQTLHNYRLLCANGLLYRDSNVCEDCLGKAIGWPGIAHRCYRGSLAASSAATAMLGLHRLLGTWTNAVDLYIALTEFGRRKLIAGGLPPHKIAVKPNFAEDDPGPGSGSGGYGLFVGRLSSEKGIATLLDAWQRLDGDVPLKIVGDGPLAPLVERAAVANPAIQYLGRLARERVSALMGEAAFLVLPSQCYESFGRVVIESYARGTPAIVSRLGAMAELVDDGRTGLHFTAGDPGDLAQKVRLLVEKDRQAMRAAARAEFTRLFTAEANYAHLMAIYQRVAGGAVLL